MYFGHGLRLWKYGPILFCIGVFIIHFVFFGFSPVKSIWPETAWGISSETIGACILGTACVSESISQFYFVFLFLLVVKKKENKKEHNKTSNTHGVETATL